jgi:hypothetical protein
MAYKRSGACPRADRLFLLEELQEYVANRLPTGFWTDEASLNVAKWEATCNRGSP